NFVVLPIAPYDGHAPFQFLQLCSKSSSFRNSTITWVESFLGDYSTLDREIESHVRPWHEERKPLASELTDQNEGAICELSLWPFAAVDSFMKVLRNASNVSELKILAAVTDGPQSLLADIQN